MQRKNRRHLSLLENESRGKGTNVTLGIERELEEREKKRGPNWKETSLLFMYLLKDTETV